MHRTVDITYKLICVGWTLTRIPCNLGLVSFTPSKFDQKKRIKKNKTTQSRNELKLCYKPKVHIH